MAKTPLMPMSETMFYVLLSLLKKERCGSEIVKHIDSLTQGRIKLGPGTLYTILFRFEEEGIIKEIGSDGRKRIYQLTTKGYQAYLSEKARLYQMIDHIVEEELR